MLPGSSFDVRPSVTTTDQEQVAELRKLIRHWARDEQDEALLLAVLGLEGS